MFHNEAFNISTVEAKMGVLFMNGQEVFILKTTLEELGHVHPQTPIYRYIGRV